MNDAAGTPLKVIIVFGTRPEAIKMAPVIREMESRPEMFDCSLAVTAQHRELLDQVLDLFGLSPAIDLDIMVRGQSLSHIATAALEGLTTYFEAEKPDVVLVHGDTTTTFTAALAAFYCGIHVGHVEAGLRTGDRFLPYPEEMNRRLTDEIASVFFAPTSLAKKRLVEREISPNQICVTGNTVVDALTDIANRPHEFADERHRSFAESKRFKILFTMHRRESWGAPMRDVFTSIAGFLDSNPGAVLLYPVHPNPAVSEPAHEKLGDISNASLIDACDYATFVHLLKSCDLVVSDSGGIQEEAPSFGKYTLVLRETTERPEVVDAGFAELCGVDGPRLAGALDRAIKLIGCGEMPPKGENPVGDGNAARRTADFLLYRFGKLNSPPKEFGE